MTTGSGNGWPDVVKVPARTTEHDPLCWYDPTKQSFSCCCALIAKVRADERERTNTVGGHRQIRDEGRADMCADLRAKVEALHNDAIRRGDTYDIDDVLALLDGGNND